MSFLIFVLMQISLLVGLLLAFHGLGIGMLLILSAFALAGFMMR